jgi:hypothetical protein
MQSFFPGSRARIPVASQVTALEIWLLACILLVFGALAEYAFILRQVINLSRQQRRNRHRAALEQGGSGAIGIYTPPTVFAPGASLTTNSVDGREQQQQSCSTRNGARNNTSASAAVAAEEWPMLGLGPGSSDLHHHHHHVVQPQQVSLETHQTERGANTTIAATTHHLHEMQAIYFGFSCIP